MNAAEFEEVALVLIAHGFSPIPIMAWSKSPGCANLTVVGMTCPSGIDGAANSLPSTRLLHGSA